MSSGEETKKAAEGGIVCAGNLIVDRVHTLSYWPEEGNLAEILHQDLGVGGGAVNVACDLGSLGLPARIALAGLTVPTPMAPISPSASRASASTPQPSGRQWKRPQATPMS